MPGSLKVQQLSGTAFKQFSVKKVDYKINQTTITIKNLTVNWQLLSLLQNKLIINKLNAKSIEIQQEKPIVYIEQVALSGQIKKTGLAIDSLRFNYLDQIITSRLQIGFDSLTQLTAKLKLNPDTKNPEIFTGALDIGGDLNHLQWTGDFHGPASLSLNGNLTKLARLEQTIKWHNVQWQKDPQTIINSPEGRLTLSGTLPDLNVTLTSKINKAPNEHWQIASTIHGTIPWKWYFDINISQPMESSSKHEGLYTSLSAKGKITASNQGDMIITLKPGHYEMPDDSPIPSLEFQGGTLGIILSPQQLAGKGSIAIDENKKLTLAFKLPKFDLNQGLVARQPINADLSLIVNSFEFLQSLSSEINNPKGQLTASLQATGTWNKKIIKSTLTLSQGRVDLPGLGLKLNSMQFIAHAQGQQWEAEGSISSENKKLNIKGKGPLGASFGGDLSLIGTDFPVMNTKEFQVKVSPQVALNISSSGLKISGSILVPFAHIQPQTFNNSISLSDDVVFKTPNETPSTPFNTNMNLHVEMGNDVELTYKGLHATLIGSVNLTQLPQGPVNATGELTVKKGQYKAYGQDLTIEQGQLIFTGGRLDNPGINVRASKKIDTTTATTPGSNQPFDFNNDNLQNANVRGNISVGVEVSGRLTEPKISLFSNPSILSQADILSMLVLGRPASQANKAGGQLLMAAISSMNLGGGTNGAQLLEQLKKNLGFDVNVQTTSNYNLATNQITDSTAVVVGKSISKKIYVSYNVGLSQNDPNVLTLKYLLNKFYSIQISSSTTSSGIDILYTSNK
ncbi:translocation/assembly module TamB domain-containing protein [Legionella fallonii]|uniref:translocation/assembly module TamB domain-containing protein n=1 Tax=Legionella fallonii TaxID=96230 RepID=UPI001E2DE6FB|nr:translocation/assembly module TamB domain-containing protein [Legionella fallonii]